MDPEDFPLNVMTPSAFVRLYEALAHPAQLEVVYDYVLNNLFENPYWGAGPTTLRRVRWNDGRKAQMEDSETFESPGLYLWGIENRPLYVGITGRSFSKRFNRYIWSDQSQCSLAEKYETELKTHGIDGFPAATREWYRRSYGGSTVRLRGAVRFAEVGIAKVWFALFPHVTVTEQIRALEKALIPVANEWNKHHDFPPLLNKQK